MSPLTSRALRGQAPRRRYAAADSDSQTPAQAVEQGQPGIEPGRTLAVSAGLLACASKHNGLLHEVWPVVRCALLVSTPLRFACALRVHATPVMSCAPQPLRAASALLMPRRIPKLVLAMASPSPQGTTARRCARS